MTATLHQLPLPPAPPPIAQIPAAPPPAFERPVLTYSMFEVARHLGVNSRSANWVKHYLEQMQAEVGFPPPLPTISKKKLTHEIVPGKSRWVASLVHAWLGKLASSDLATAIDEEQLRQASFRLDQSAENLFGGNA